MARSATVTLEGAAQLRRALRRITPETDKELAGELKSIADGVLDDARPAAPQLTGELAKSLRISVTQRRVTIYSLLPQAGVIHWGGTISPRGVPITFPRTEFVTRAAELQSARLVNQVGDAFDRAARKASWR